MKLVTKLILIELVTKLVSMKLITKLVSIKLVSKSVTKLVSKINYQSFSHLLLLLIFKLVSN